MCFFRPKWAEMAGKMHFNSLGQRLIKTNLRVTDFGDMVVADPMDRLGGLKPLAQAPCGTEILSFRCPKLAISGLDLGVGCIGP